MSKQRIDKEKCKKVKNVLKKEMDIVRRKIGLYVHRYFETRTKAYEELITQLSLLDWTLLSLLYYDCEKLPRALEDLKEVYRIYNERLREVLKIDKVDLYERHILANESTIKRIDELIKELKE